MIFYLGTHKPNWLQFSWVPLFISAITLRESTKTQLYQANCDWALDSGGFSILNKYGYWPVSPRQYVAEVTRWMQMGRMQWAAIQDWMCEEEVRRKTGKTTYEHQLLTVENYLELMYLDRDIPWVPVLQGQRVEDYLRHVDMYAEHGIDLTKNDVVGVGSVCRRQGTREAVLILKALHALGINIHAFGFKIDGLRNAAQYCVSSDSLAWSRGARYEEPLPGHTHKTCANCFEYAMIWRDRVLSAVTEGRQIQELTEKQTSFSFGAV